MVIKDSPNIFAYTVCPEVKPIPTNWLVEKPVIALPLLKFTTALEARYFVGETSAVVLKKYLTNARLAGVGVGLTV